MSSLQSGIRCLRGFRAPVKTIRSHIATPKRGITTTSSKQDESLLLSIKGNADEVEGVYARPVPTSPSYFSRFPQFNDSFVQIQELAQKYGRLPTLSKAEVERISWKTKDQFRRDVGEKVKARDFATCMTLVKKLHSIHPELMPPAVLEGILPFKRHINALDNGKKVAPIDKFGRTHGVGKRKSSVAQAWVVEGDGEVLINGKTLNDMFGRVHDRESALWGLKTTERLDKYNVWAKVEGGGSTGQAEALAMAIAKALMVHEPPLKTILRRAGCITRDYRTVERKKPGHLKARKSPAWVKR
ncbi:40S ribosomal protein S9 [Xylariaceae sp. FL1019]|nr:40S ribosomal protein S9 [Xylariaceae sp. FL1019]